MILGSVVSFLTGFWAESYADADDFGGFLMSLNPHNYMVP